MKSKLMNILDIAYNNVVVYMNKRIEFEVDKDENSLNKLPIMYKNEFAHDCEAGIAAKDIMKLYKGELLKFETSGSTGVCLDVYWSYSDYMRSMLLLWRLRKKWYGIKTTDKECFFYTTPRQEEKIENGVRYVVQGNTLSFNKLSLEKDNLTKVYEKIKEYSPKWMILQPSMALRFVNLVKKQNLDGLEELIYIELTGEYVTHKQKQLIKDTFKCNVASQYGAIETNSIAYECIKGNLHCMKGNVIVEVLDEITREDVLDKEGDIIVTSLMNTTMPMVRYAIGDRGMILSKRCSCGCDYPIIKLSSSRNNDIVIMNKENSISADVFYNAICKVNSVENRIIQFQICQDSYNEFSVVFVINNKCYKYRQNIEKEFIDSIENESLKKAQFTFEYSEELLQNTKTGKLKWFTCNI